MQSNTVSVGAGHQVSDSVSQGLKTLANDPILGLYFVHKHIREKGGPDLCNLKSQHLQQLTKVRQVTAESKSNPRSRRGLDAMNQLLTKLEKWNSQLDSFKSSVQPSHESPSKLPLGMGQTLDNNLLHGDIDVDEYAIRLAQIADSIDTQLERDEQH